MIQVIIVIVIDQLSSLCCIAMLNQGYIAHIKWRILDSESVSRSNSADSWEVPRGVGGLKPPGRLVLEGSDLGVSINHKSTQK